MAGYPDGAKTGSLSNPASGRPKWKSTGNVKMMHDNSAASIAETIVQLLQEIVIDRAQEIYEQQKDRLNESIYADESSMDFVSLGNGLITIKEGNLFSENPHTRYPIGWEDIAEIIEAFKSSKRGIGAVPGMDYAILDQELLPLTCKLLTRVSYLLKFLELDYRTDTPRFRVTNSGISYHSGIIKAAKSVGDSTQAKVHTCNDLLKKLAITFQAFCGVNARILPEGSLGIETPIATNEMPGSVTAKHASSIPKNTRTRRKPSATEKLIIMAINESPTRRPAWKGLCILLDNNKALPRPSWEKGYPWPKSWVKAFDSKDGRVRRYWRKQMRTWAQNIKRDFPDLIKVTKSPR